MDPLGMLSGVSSALGGGTSSAESRGAAATTTKTGAFAVMGSSSGLSNLTILLIAGFALFVFSKGRK